MNYAKERTVVIISDALRYEVAHSLFEKLQADEKCTTSISAMQGVLPSYTPLGMASLLPHRKIEYSDSYDVLVDGKVCASTEQREARLREYKVNSKCIQFDAFKNMKQADLRNVFTGQDVVYVYHNQVDARGDAAKTENEVFMLAKKRLKKSMLSFAEYLLRLTHITSLLLPTTDLSISEIKFRQAIKLVVRQQNQTVSVSDMLFQKKQLIPMVCAISA